MYKMLDNMHHYVYYSYEDWGRGYIGVRQCECNIAEDVYFGSYYDKTFNPTNKIILLECATREEALEAEVVLHKFYNVKDNPHFANQSNQTSSGFDYNNRGIPMSEEQKEKLRQSKKGQRKGIKQSPEHIAKRLASRKESGNGWSKETNQKISDSLKGNVPWNKDKSTGTMDNDIKKKISDTMKGRKSPMKGRKQSPETIAKRVATRAANKLNADKGTTQNNRR